MRMLEGHHVDMEVTIKSYCFKLARVRRGNISAEVLKMFGPTLLYGFHNRHQTDTEWTIYGDHTQSSVLPQIVGIFRTFLTTGSGGVHDALVTVTILTEFVVEMVQYLGVCG
jgi:hypothetical protein